ncbi:hypothetical protein [Sphingomonas sanguinis]|uniref:Uncharacterized protein n=1 Tax=Sphingomonas sanguinis TaxID=33051 RepID=A0A147HYS5_9SPHN|nr:hypothetical protein [Sphingomonas sanguinis]KTT70153.1 hypothetical protein NS319_08375 [Sphingomonas sanguinis]
MLDPDMPLRAAAGSDAAIAFALFQHIAERDPQSVAAKDDAISVFRECMAAVGRSGAVSHEPRPIRLGGE